MLSQPLYANSFGPLQPDSFCRKIWKRKDWKRRGAEDAEFEFENFLCDLSASAFHLLLICSSTAELK